MSAIIKEVAEHAQCKKCGKWFPISKQLQDLIINGLIHPLEVNLCTECAEYEQEQEEHRHELECILNEY